MNLARLRRGLGMLTLGAALHVCGPAQAAGMRAVPPLIGHTIADAQASAFVRFFHLQQNYQAPDSAHPGMVLTIIGSTGQFKGVANLMLVTKQGDDAVVRAGLMVRRDFIDGSGTAVFARDIAKSFVEVSTVREVPEVRALYDTLRACQQSAAATCPGTEPATLAWNGRQDKHRIDATDGYLMLQDSVVMNVPMLFIENGPAER